MPLKEVGEAMIAKSGKSLHIEYEPIGSLFKHHLFISAAGLRKLLAGSQFKVKVVTIVHESRVSEKFDL